MATRTTRSFSNARARSLSLSLTLALAFSWASKPTLETLPTEILLEIVQLAASSPRNPHAHRLGSYGSDSDSDADDGEGGHDQERPELDQRTLRSLALTSRVLATLAHAVLYRSVNFDSSRPAGLFARTVTAAAHHDITLSAASSPISPVSPAFLTKGPSTFLGKSTMRLTLSGSATVDRGRNVNRLVASRMLAEQDRFLAAAGALLGLGPTAPSLPSPVLSSLRTLTIRAELLAHFSKTSSSQSMVCPTPAELILDTYLPATAALGPSSLAPLFARLTHLFIAAPPPTWRLPSETLSALGGAPALTHLALVRKAGANEDNDAEFAADLQQIISDPARAGTLACVVVVILSDVAFGMWEAEQRDELSNAEGLNDIDIDIDPRIRTLESYLSTSHIWTSIASLASTSPLGAPRVFLVPGRGDAWGRAVRDSSGHGSKIGNIYLEKGCSPLPLEFWTWARASDSRRRVREARKLDPVF